MLNKYRVCLFRYHLHFQVSFTSTDVQTDFKEIYIAKTDADVDIWELAKHIDKDVPDDIWEIVCMYFIIHSDYIVILFISNNYNSVSLTMGVHDNIVNYLINFNGIL